MRKIGLTLGLASCALLASCGGGGSGSGSVGVAPGGGTPTPTGGSGSGGTLSTGEIKPTADATYLAATMEMTTAGSTSADLTGQTSGGTTSSRLTLLDTPGFTGSYSATTGYQLRDAVNNVTFGPAQLTSDTTASDTYYPTVLFTRLASPVADYLALYKESVTTSSILGSGTVVPKYAGVGGWQHSVASGASHRTRLDYFAFGPATPVGAMPHSGVFKFTIMGSGNYAGDADLYFTTTADTLTVDFGAGTVSGMIGGSGQNLFNGGIAGLYAVTVNGTINGNMATGATSSSVAVATGQYRLLFVGPNADELIVTHVGQNGRGDYVGAAVGVRNPYLP